MQKTARIKRVYLDYFPGAGDPDISLNIHMDNGQSIMLNIDEKNVDVSCLNADILKYDSDPQTDGSRFYWPGGASVTMDDVMETLCGNAARITGVETYEGKSNEIDVTLFSGHTINLSLPAEYAAGGQPQTDGERVYWESGLSLSLDEITAMFLADGGKPASGQDDKPDSDAKRMRKRARVVMSLAACAAVVVIVAIALQGFQEPVVNLDGDDVPLAEMPFAVTFPEIEDVTMTAGTGNISLPLSNPLFSSICYIYEITLSDTGETLYISELVEPGMILEDVELIRPLGKGEHSVVLNIRAYDFGGNELIDEANVGFLITVT